MSAVLEAVVNARDPASTFVSKPEHRWKGEDLATFMKWFEELVDRREVLKLQVNKPLRSLLYFLITEKRAPNPVCFHADQNITVRGVLVERM